VRPNTQPMILPVSDESEVRPERPMWILPHRWFDAWAGIGAPRFRVAFVR